MPFIYTVVRYGPILLVAIWLGAIRTEYLRVVMFTLAMTAVLAVAARRRVGDVRISIPMAFMFDLPGAAVATAVGWTIGALLLRNGH